MKIIKTLFAIFVAIAATILMAFYYDKIGSTITLVIVIGSVALLLPRFLRRHFGTDKLNYIEEVITSYRIDVGSFFWNCSWSCSSPLFSK